MSAVAIAAMLFAAGCMAGDGTGNTSDLGTGKASTSDRGPDKGFVVSNPVSLTNLTADQPGVAANVAPSLVNAWGVAQFDGMFWIADGGTGKVSIFDGNGVPATGKVASGAIDLGAGITGVAVTGVVANDTITFSIHTPGAKAPAQLIFASERGTLIGVNPDLSTTGGFVVVDRSRVDASYKGVAVVQGERGPLVLAADFHNARIDVFDASFGLVTDISFEVRRAMPEMPAGFAPFNVMTFNHLVYVTYAQQDADKADAVAGAGLGFVATFDASGKPLKIAKGDAFNAPWGMALACNSGAFSNTLLVGNFGDGHITVIERAAAADEASDTSAMKVRGQLMDKTGVPIAIDGLWGLSFGAAVANARPDGLFFAAGPDDETHGLFGVVAPVAAP